MNEQTETRTGARLMRLPKVLEVTGISRSGWLRLVKEGYAPSPVKLSPRTTAWVEAEVQDYITSRIKERVA